MAIRWRVDVSLDAKGIATVSLSTAKAEE